MRHPRVVLITPQLFLAGGLCDDCPNLSGCTTTWEWALFMGYASPTFFLDSTRTLHANAGESD